MGGVSAPPPRCHGDDWVLGVPVLLHPLQSPSVTSGTRHLDLRMLPETTTEAPGLPPNLHGAWPTTILYPSPSLGLDLLSFTSQPAVSTAISDKGFLCFSVVSGRGWNCREPGCSPLVFVKGGHYPETGLLLTLCPLGGRIRFNYFPNYFLGEGKV